MTAPGQPPGAGSGQNLVFATNWGLWLQGTRVSWADVDRAAWTDGVLRVWLVGPSGGAPSPPAAPAPGSADGRRLLVDDPAVGPTVGAPRIVVGDGAASLTVELNEPGRLPDVVRAEVDHSVVVTRRAAVGSGPRGVVAALRRDPRTGQLRTQVRLDPGLDVADPPVRAAVADALRQLREDVGDLGGGT